MNNIKNMIKVNMHLVEACNYSCKYCFAKFEDHKILYKTDWMSIIDNCIKSGRVSEINFAGGEPLLVPYLHELAEYVNSLGVRCSLITNGSLMTDEWIRKYAGLFRTIGMSVDTFDSETARRVGRCDRRGNVQTAERTADIIRNIKAFHPDVKVKLNTVVNALNVNENLAEFIVSEKLPVDRWKLLKMCYFNDGCHNNASLAVTDDQYREFVCSNLREFGVYDISDDQVLYNTASGTEIVAERKLKGGYYMIDAGGRLVDDTTNDSYKSVIDCRTEQSITDL